MILNIFAIAGVLGLAYLWAIRGMFSALLHTACVIVAGAVAFAMWEPVGNWLIGAAPARGFFSYLGDAARGVSLLVVFGITLLLCRLASDGLVRGNVKLPFLANLLGGMVVALPGSVITTGVVIIALSHINFGTKLFGFQPVTYTEKGGLFSGQLEQTGTLWIPADALTADFYAFVSERSFSTSQPLARWYPDLELSGHTDRMTFSGKGRIAIPEDGVRIEARYAVGDPLRGGSTDDVLGERQRPMTLGGEPVGNGRIEGFVLLFSPNASEETSQMIFSAGPVRLVTENPATGERLTIHPVAVVSENRDQSRFERFPFEAANQYVSTVGADQAKSMAFEFFVPTGHEPRGIYVRGRRLEIPSPNQTQGSTPGGTPGGTEDGDVGEQQVFASPAERDASIPLLMGGARLASLDTSDAVEIEREGNSYQNIITRANIGVTLISGTVKPALTLDDDNRIIDGEIRMDINDTSSRNVADTLRVRDFGVPQGVRIVQITMSGSPEDNPISLLGDIFRTSSPGESTLHLVDNQMRTYQPVGYIVQNNQWFDLRYTPASPLGTLRDLPDADPTNPEGQEIVLVFQVSQGTQLEALAINERALVVFDPPLEVR